MKIPKIISKKGRKYILDKEYETYAVYKDKKTGAKECFKYQELGLIKEKVKPYKRARKGGMIII